MTRSGPWRSMGPADLAAGTSTGGITYKPVGRVGDSSVIGSGCYADNESAAVSCTGEGEAIMRLVLGKWAVDRVAEGLDPQQAAEAAIERLRIRLGAGGGLILLDRTWADRHRVQHATDGLGRADRRRNGRLDGDRRPSIAAG